MTTVETNVIFSALNPQDRNHSRAKHLLDGIGQEEALVLSPVVYSELMASRSRVRIVGFLEEVGIEIAWEMPSEVWTRAGEAFGEYARQRLEGSLPRRIVADFLIAAHAEHHALSVLTFDDKVYKFFELEVRP